MVKYKFNNSIFQIGGYHLDFKIMYNKITNLYQQNNNIETSQMYEHISDLYLSAVNELENKKQNNKKINEGKDIFIHELDKYIPSRSNIDIYKSLSNYGQFNCGIYIHDNKILKCTKLMKLHIVFLLNILS